MSGLIQLLVAQQPKGMDLEKGVPASKDGEKFAEVLNTEVESANEDIETAPTEGPGEDVRPPEEESDDSEETEVALPSMLTIPNLVASFVQEELKTSPEEGEAALMNEKVSPVPADGSVIDMVMSKKEVKIDELSFEKAIDISELEEVSADEASTLIEDLQLNELPTKEVLVSENPIKETIALETAPMAPMASPKKGEVVEEPAMPVIEKSLAHGESVEAITASAPSKDHGDLSRERGDESSRPMDLRSFSESLFVQKNLLKADASSFDQELRQLQATDTGSHLKPQIMREIEPLMTRVSLSKIGGEMTIQLKPENLGALKVDVKVEGDLVKVNFQAESQSTRSALQAQVQDLKQSMNLVGLKVDQVQVASLMTHENARNGQSSHQQQQPQPQERHQSQQNQQEQQKAAREAFEQELMEMSV